MTSLRRFASDPNVGIGHVGPVFINVWRGVPTAASLTTLGAAQRLLLGPHVVVTVVMEIPRGRLNAEERQIAEAIQLEHRDRVRGHANVVEATGFVGAAVRMVMTSGNLMKNNTYPVKVFSTTTEALLWLSSTWMAIDKGVNVSDVAAAIDALRADGLKGDPTP